MTSDTPSSLPTSGRESVTITGGDNVVSVGQIGGITAKTVTVNPPVRPEFRIISKNETENPDGTHTITMTGEVVSPVTPGLMIVSIKAQGMRAANIISEPTGVGSSTLKRNIVRAPDSYSAEILSPRGRYIVVVDVDKLTNIDFNVAF